MQLRPEIEALRGDDMPQRRAQAALGAAMDRWRAEPQPAAVLADLHAFEQGEDIALCPALAALARRADDPLAAPAGALRAQLLESWPQLAQLETAGEMEAAACPA